MKFPVVSLLGAVILLRAGEGACGQEPLRAAAFRLPDVPAALTEPAERADYLALHYWDRFDFVDTTLVRRPEITEQAFADFVCILPYAPRAGAAVDSLFARAEVAKGMFCHFMELGDKYLDEPASPLYNEVLYALFLRAQLDSPLLEEVEKIGPRTRLAVMSKNRPGDRAEDFTFRCRDGSCGRLSEIGAEYTLLYFNAPDCADCRRAKAYLASSSAVARFAAGQAAGRCFGMHRNRPRSVEGDGLPDGVDRRYRRRTNAYARCGVRFEDGACYLSARQK